jgi:erythrocyte band 7 integral membrane protein
VTVFVNAIMYYYAVSNVDDYSGSARLLAATTLRTVLGTLTLVDILCPRESTAHQMKVRVFYKQFEKRLMMFFHVSEYT